MEIPPAYRGREQAYIKHLLLTKYLERLFMIIGQQHAPQICYVDCFAGPWQEGTANLEDTSIAISLRIMQQCRAEYERLGWQVPNFRALYIEKNDSAFHKLETYLADRSPDGIDARALHGEFIPLRGQILQWCGDRDFAFFFIDPKGWKDVGLNQLRPLLQRPNAEFLINFMYNFVNFTLPQETFREDMENLLGENLGEIPRESREEVIIHRYREQLKQVVPAGGGRPRTAHVRVLNPLIDRPWYHLVYLTRHPKGIQVFMEVSEGLKEVQEQVRERAKQARRIEKTGQLDFFAHLGTDIGSAATEGVLSEVKRYWLSQVTHQSKQFGVPELADMLEETGWFIGTLQRGIGELIDEGLVENLDAQRKRPKNPIHFEKNERLRLTAT